MTPMRNFIECRGHASDPREGNPRSVPRAKEETWLCARSNPGPKAWRPFGIRNPKRVQYLKLSLAAFALGIALADFVPRVALADYVDSSTATHNLAIRMTILQCTNR